jgi:autotransporter-associated beta strand protein
MTITSTNANRLLVFNNDLTGYSGVIAFGASVGQFRFNNRTNDSPTTGSAAALFDLGSGSATLFNVSGTNQTYNIGALAGLANTTLSGSATNGGAAATTYSIGARGGNTSFAGRIVNGQDVVSVNKVGNGTLALNGVNTYTGPTTVSAGALGGTGSLAGPLTVQAGGTLALNTPMGVFTVSNNVTLGCQVIMDLSQGSTPQNSKLVATGTITATGGTLVVANIGPDISNGTKFVLFNQAVTGFSSITLPSSNPANTSAYIWQTNITVDGSITLVSGGGGGSPVNTNPTNIVLSVSGNTMSLSWPGDHLGWQLQSNSVGLTATNQWFPIPGSTSTTQENLTFDPLMTNVFFRMIYPPLP